MLHIFPLSSSFEFELFLNPFPIVLYQTTYVVGQRFKGRAHPFQFIEKQEDIPAGSAYYLWIGTISDLIGASANRAYRSIRRG